MSTVTLWEDGDPLSPSVLNSKLSPLLSGISGVLGIGVQSDGSSLGTATTINIVGSSSVSSQAAGVISIQLPDQSHVTASHVTFDGQVSFLSNVSVFGTFQFDHAVLGPLPSAETGWMRISNDPTIPVMAYRNNSDTSDWPLIQIGSATEEDDFILGGWLRINPSSRYIEPVDSGTGSIGGAGSGPGFERVDAKTLTARVQQPTTLFNGALELSTTYPNPSDNTNAFALVTTTLGLLILRAGNTATDIALSNTGQRSLFPMPGKTVALGRDTVPWDEMHARYSRASGVVAHHVGQIANYSVTTRDYTVSFNSDSTLTATLPDPSTVTGQFFHVKNLGSQPVFVVSTSTASIDNASVHTLASAFSGVAVQSIGTRYIVL